MSVCQYVGQDQQDWALVSIASQTRERQITQDGTATLGDDSGMFKMLFHRENGRLLGCHCIGSGATELIHSGQAVIGLGGGLEYFLKTVFNYLTLAECYKVAAYNAANKLALIRQATGAVLPAMT